MKLLVINGPNLNMLGLREQDIYGKNTYKDLVEYIKKTAESYSVKIKFFQSNSEGAIVTAIQKAVKKYDGVIINAGAYSHTSIAIPDALRCLKLFPLQKFI